MLLYEAQVQKFGRHTHTEYCWDMDTTWAPLHAYPRCIPFFPQKKFLGTGCVRGWVRAGLKVAKATSFSRQKLFDSHSLSRSIYFSLYCPHSAAALSHHHFVGDEAARE